MSWQGAELVSTCGSATAVRVRLYRTWYAGISGDARRNAGIGWGARGCAGTGSGARGRVAGERPETSERGAGAPHGHP
jgi:hypothetical protein